MTYDPPPLFTPPNLWRIVSRDGQPPANTLVDYMYGDTPLTCQMGDNPNLTATTRWRLSDLPPLDAVQPAPAPERPEPKFKIGDRVQAANINGPSMIVGRTWVGTFWLYEMDTDEEVPEDLLRPAPAPEPSIPIGGWFDPGDGRTLQRVTCPTERIPDCALIHYENNGVHPGLVGTTCSPLTEREAMERLYPAGTWLRDRNHDDSFVVREWWDGAAGPIAGVSFDDRRTGSMDGIYIHEHCTVLPDPPLTAPWRPLDELPEDGVQVLALRTSGGYSLEWAEHVRISSSFAVWADLDDVAPIPAHLRGGA